MHRLLFAAALASVIGACGGTAAEPTTNLAIAIAPLTLPDVDEACYTVTVKNGDSPPAIVWTKPGICSSVYGNSQGAISYIGPCDAQSPAHSVELTLTSLAAGGTALVHPEDYVNPTATGPIVLPATCEPNRDTAVVFNLTVMRSAMQGTYDIAVNFDDVFCSAKLDCAAGALLHDPAAGMRVPTAVVGLACSGGPAADTHLYYSALALVCDGVPIPLPLAGPPGNFYSLTSPAPDPFAQVASYQGVEQLTNPDGTSLAKIFFNFAFALPAGATGNCSLSFSATASDGALDDCTTPPKTVYPVMHFNAPNFVTNGTFGCGQNGLDESGGVWTSYVGPITRGEFALEAHAAGNALTVSSCGFCGDADIDAGESCDPPDSSPCPYGVTSCARCSATCQTTTGTSGGTCGDGIVQAGNESCEPGLGVPACDTLGTFDGGTVSCTASCAYDTGACTWCGDGVREGAEVCDGSDIATSCVDEGYDEGTIACSATCTLDTSGCTDTVTGICGNGVLEPGEQCDPPTEIEDCPPGVAGCLVCAAGCVLVPGNPGTPLTTFKLPNGAPSGCVPQAGTSTHCVVARISCDDSCEVWLDGTKYWSFDSSKWWTPKTVTIGGLASGCHVLGVRTQDVFNVAAGFVGSISIDGAVEGDDGFYTTAQSDAITVNPTAANDAQGDTWSELDYDLSFPPASQCVAISIWDGAPWRTWSRQYYDHGAYPLWYNTACQGDHTEAYARIVFTIPEVPGATCAGIVVPVCGDGTVDAPEECEPPNEPGDACVPVGGFCTGCGPTCELEQFTDCSGKPTVATGNVNWDYDSAPADNGGPIAFPECITTWNGNLTINGGSSSDPLIRLPSLKTIQTGGGGNGTLTIGSWPDGVALLPSLESASFITAATPTPRHIVLPALKGAGAATVQVQDNAGQPATFTLPLLEKGRLFLFAASTMNVGNAGTDISVFSDGGNGLVTFPSSVTTLFTVRNLSGTLTFDAPGLTTVTHFRLDGGTIAGLASVTTLGPGTHSLFANASLPAVTTVEHINTVLYPMLAYNPKTALLPALQSITAIEVNLFGSGAVTLPGTLVSVSGELTAKFTGITSLMAGGLVAARAIDVEQNNSLASLSLPALRTVPGSVSDGFIVKNNPLLPPGHPAAILAALTTAPPTPVVCNNGGVAPFCP